MRRKPIVVGNWKLHNTIAEAVTLAQAVVDGLGGDERVEVGVAPVFTALYAVNGVVDRSPVRLVAQTCHDRPEGAFTGEVSPPHLRDVGCDWVILGHSERRQLFGETDEAVNAKVRAVLAEGLGAIVCVGETLEQREAGQTESVVLGQVEAALAGLSGDDIESLVLAYEPVWAIGTGRTATADQAQEVHARIRGWVHERFGEAAAQGLRIQYGGSVKPGNAAELMGQADVDGALVGGASLRADSFLAIVAATPGE